MTITPGSFSNILTMVSADKFHILAISLTVECRTAWGGVSSRASFLISKALVSPEHAPS
jgi:hypothetical protein